MIQVRRGMSRVLLGMSVAILATFSSCASFPENPGNNTGALVLMLDSKDVTSENYSVLMVADVESGAIVVQKRVPSSRSFMVIQDLTEGEYFIQGRRYFHGGEEYSPREFQHGFTSFTIKPDTLTLFPEYIEQKNGSVRMQYHLDHIVLQEFHALKEAYPRETGSWRIHLEED